MAAVQKTIDAVAALEKYEHGFTSDIDLPFCMLCRVEKHPRAVD